MAFELYNDMNEDGKPEIKKMYLNIVPCQYISVASM